MDALAELFEFPRDGGKDVFAVGEGAGDVPESQQAAQGSFGEAAGVGVGLVELPTDLVGRDIDREFFHTDERES